MEAQDEEDVMWGNESDEDLLAAVARVERLERAKRQKAEFLKK